MKKSRKLMSILLVVAMLFTLAAPAMADETTYTITINNSATNHTYEAYQIFAGDLHDGVLSNITWGSGVNGDNLLAELKTNPSYESCTSAEAVANVLKGFENDSAELNAFAKIVGKHLGTAADTTNTVTDEKYTLDSLTAGYYLVKDKDESQAGNNDVYTGYILKVVKDTTATPKLSTKPTAEKKVDDKNDSNTTENEVVWQDSADYDIGDAVPFQLKGTVPADYDNYNTYYYVFHDKESAGLTFDETSVKVYVNGVEITDNANNKYYEVKTETSCDNDCTFEIVFDNLKEITSVTAGSTITVEYTSILNERAVIGSEGNPNVMYLEYSNNPNVGGEGDTGRTPDDKVIVFTYQTVINKVDEKGEALAGAEFTLEKKQADGEWKAINVVETEAGTTFTFKGLDDGLYRLTETKTPAGYNTIDPIEFIITATHDEEADNPTLTSLSGNVESGEVTFTSDEKVGSLTTDVVNQSGATLPETGGIGTTVFYVLGGALVLGAVVLLVTRRRMAE